MNCGKKIELNYSMLVFTNHITPRLNYIIQTLLGTEVIIVNDISTFINYDKDKINYSPNKITNNELWIVPNNLLNTIGIHEQQIDCFEWNGLKAFFKTDGDIPFDIFSASFYLLSRYEEYLLQ